MTRRIVLKIGTSVLTGGTRKLDHDRMFEIVRQCAALHEEGYELIVCTSGAIAAGSERLRMTRQPDSLAEKQMLAAVGQSRLMEIWEQLFTRFHIHVGQMLLTRADVEDRRRFLNARDTLSALLEHRIVPVINENDAVTTAEIRVGDNDNLSALCVLLAEADLLILLSDQPGLFTADPRTDPNAELIAEVRRIDADLHAVAGESKSGLGVGGMKTKLDAADMARRAGACVVIAAGDAPEAIRRIVAGERIGTRFPALDVPVENRKRWILGGANAAGAVAIDQGAAAALAGGGGSLLPAGIIRVDGSFERGDVVQITAADRTNLGRGVVRYDSADVGRIRGLQSDRIRETLGYAYGPVVIHRDDLILI